MYLLICLGALRGRWWATGAGWQWRQAQRVRFGCEGRVLAEQRGHHLPRSCPYVSAPAHVRTHLVCAGSRNRVYRHGRLTFPERVEAELAKYKEEHDRVTRITSQLSADDLVGYAYSPCGVCELAGLSSDAIHRISYMAHVAGDRGRRTRPSCVRRWRRCRSCRSASGCWTCT